MSSQKSNIVFLHENSDSSIKNGVKISKKEKLIDGDKGLSFHYLNKSSKKFYMVTVKEISKDKFSIREKEDDKEIPDKIVDAKGLKTFVSKNKKLNFVAKYLKVRSKIQKGGAKKSSRKSSKKAKKSSRKSSKKAKKSSRKSSRRRSSRK